MRILRPAQIYRLRMGMTITPASWGGDSSSDSSTSTLNDTKNYDTNTDRRAISGDSAVALSGDNNTVDRSTSNLTQFFDTSNRSSSTVTEFRDNSNRSTNFSDSSNRSTNFADNSNRSVNTTVTDYGSVGGSLSLAGSMSTKAFEVADGGIKGAIDTLKLQSSAGAKMVEQAFDLARSSGANALGTSAQVIGLANSAIQKTEAAMTQAKDGGQSKMVMAALAAVGAIGVALALR
jgi:hypothetical protein